MSHSQTTRTAAASRGRFVLLVLASVACLTLLFTAQDAMRRGANGVPVVWSRALAINALDWVTWGVLVPFIVVVGRRIRLDGSGHRAARIGGWIALGIAFCAVQATITGLVIRYSDPQRFGLGGGPGGPVTRPLGSFLWGWFVGTSSLNMLIFGMTAGVFHAALYYRDLRARQLREAELETRLARAELTVLRMQLQPHFFFNALHTVSSLMVSDVPTAQRVVTAIGDLLRASLDHTARQEIPLRDELAFVERFLEVQRARFRNRLTVDVTVPDDLLDALVPSFVLQPLVENAVRHGIEPHPHGGRIWVRVARSGDAVSLTVRNDGATPATAARDGAVRGGIGLANIEARLQQLYGRSHTFAAAHNDLGHFEVSLSLPLHTDATLFPARANSR